MATPRSAHARRPGNARRGGDARRSLDTVRSRSAPAPRELYAALLAHELRAPTAALQLYLRLLAQGHRRLDEPRLDAYLDNVHGEAERLSRLVGELASLTDPGAPSDPAMAWLTAAAAPTLPDLLRALAGSHPLHLDVSPEAARAPVEQARLRLILQQLVEYARASAGPRSPIRVGAEVTSFTPQRLVVRVALDQAPPGGARRPSAPRGTPSDPPWPGEAPRAGGPVLQQAQDERGVAQDERARQALLVARRVAEGAGGTLAVQPGAPAGTTFCLELPLSETRRGPGAAILSVPAAPLDAETLRAIRDVRLLRDEVRREREARELAEAQQLRAVEDFRAAHRRALDIAGQLDDAYLQTVTALARAVEARDGYTGGHVDRVARYSICVARALGLQGDDLRQVHFGAVLHDVGKIGVPDAVLRSGEALRPEQWELMRRHPTIGEDLLDGIAFLDQARLAVKGHHERWDGRGYPRGLRGTEIPLAARIVAVGDAYDAMTSDRPYRAALAHEQALEEIHAGRGTQFDPDIAAVFLANPPELVPATPPSGREIPSEARR